MQTYNYGQELPLGMQKKHGYHGDPRSRDNLGGKGLCRLMQSTNVSPVIPTATFSREELRAHQENIEKVISLWFLLAAQATKVSATLVVQR